MTSDPYPCRPTAPKVGERARWPSSVADHTGRPVSIADYAGRMVLVYFFPRDQTEGCVIPSYGLGKGGRLVTIPIIAVSLDGAEAGEQFLRQTGNQCTVMNDADHIIRHCYGILVRSSGHHHAFVIDVEGMILRVWSGIDTAVLWEIVANLGPSD